MIFFLALSLIYVESFIFHAGKYCVYAFATNQNSTFKIQALLDFIWVFLAFIDALLRKMMFSNDAARLVLMLSQRNFAPKRFEQIDINMRYLMNS